MGEGDSFRHSDAVPLELSPWQQEMSAPTRGGCCCLNFLHTFFLLNAWKEKLLWNLRFPSSALLLCVHGSERALAHQIEK